MWLPNSPDHVKWVMEEPLDMPEIPMVELPDQLSDLIGDLIEEQDELNDAAEDVTSAWADSMSRGRGGRSPAGRSAIFQRWARRAISCRTTTRCPAGRARADRGGVRARWWRTWPRGWRAADADADYE